MTTQPAGLRRCEQLLDNNPPRVQVDPRCQGFMCPVPADPDIAYRCDTCGHTVLTDIGHIHAARQLLTESKDATR